MAHERGVPRTSSAPYSHEEKVVYPQRLRESGGTSIITLSFAFMTGATVAFLILSMTPQSEASEMTHSHSVEVTEALNLLTVLDLDIYADTVIKKGLTVSLLAKMNLAEVGSDFRPFHWKRIVSEAKKMRGKITSGSPTSDGKQQPPLPPQQKIPTASENDEVEVARNVETEEIKTPPPLPKKIPGSRDEEPSKVSGSIPESIPVSSESSPKLPPKGIPGAVPGSIPGSVPVAAAKKPPTRDASGSKVLKVLPPPTASRVTGPPRPGFASNSLIPFISKEESAVCGSMARSKVLKKEYLKMSAQEQQPVDGVQDIPICEGTPVVEVPSVSAEDMTSKKIPMETATSEKRFVKNDITKQKVLEFRRRGTAEQWYIDKELKFFYCVVPKAGCTTLKAWMLNNAKLFKGGTVHNRQLYNGPRIQNIQFVPDDELIPILNSGEYFKFTVVRSPYTRVLATYLERFENCEKQTRRTKQECDMWKRALIGKTNGLPADNSSFAEILDVMKKNPLPSVDFRNSHWLPNVDVCSMNEIKYDWVGRLEDPTDLDLIYNITGAEKMKDKRKSKGLRHSEGTSSKMKSYYSDLSRDLVSEIYSDTDILRLGYHAKGVVPNK